MSWKFANVGAQRSTLPRTRGELLALLVARFALPVGERWAADEWQTLATARIDRRCEKRFKGRDLSVERPADRILYAREGLKAHVEKRKPVFRGR